MQRENVSSWYHSFESEVNIREKQRYHGKKHLHVDFAGCVSSPPAQTPGGSTGKCLADCQCPQSEGSLRKNRMGHTNMKITPP